MKSKKILGERLLTDQFNENTSEHLHRYALATEYCYAKSVLDIACGEGYGSNLLAKVARNVTGVDINEDTIKLAKNKYKKSNIEFLVGRADNIPGGKEQFDVIVSFETLEHHDKHTEMMLEIKRVLKPMGLCIISTPDKLYYSDKKYKQNPFHVKELYKKEFKDLLAFHFKNVIIFKQKFICGSLVIPENETNGSLNNYSGNYEKIDKGQEINGEYLIALASDTEIIVYNYSIFFDEKFVNNKITEFKSSSMRYKLGNLILNPIKLFKNKILRIK